MKPLLPILLCAALSGALAGGPPPLPPYSPPPAAWVSGGGDPAAVGAVVVDGERIPPHPQVPGLRTVLKDGTIYNMRPELVRYYCESATYFVEHRAVLDEGEWVRIGRASPTNGVATFVHDHPEGFYRVVRVPRPHPPTQAEASLGRTEPTNRPTRGGLR